MPADTPAAPGADESAFRLRRLPLGVGGHPERTPLLFTLAILLLAAQRQTGETTPALSAAFGIAAIGVAAIALRDGFVALRAAQVASPRVRLGPTALAFADPADEPIETIAYGDLHSIEAYGWISHRGIVLTRIDTGRILLADSLFEAPDDAPRFARALQRRVETSAGDPDRVALLRARAEAGRRAHRVPWIAVGTVAALLALFALQESADATTDGGIRALGAASGTEILGGRVDGLVARSLLHVGPAHLAVNVLMLLILSSLVEGLLGRARFSILLGASAAAGEIASCLYDAERVSVGASAGLMGVLGAIVFLNVARRRELPTWGLVGRTTLALFVALTALTDVAGDIDTIAHVGGFAAGVVVCGLLVRGRSLATLADETPPALVALAVLVAAAYGAGAVLIAVRAWGVA